MAFKMLVNLRSPYRRNNDAFSLTALLLVLLLLPFAAEAQQPTTTSLVVAPNPAMVGEVVTLTAKVTSSGNPVTVGTVRFSSGKQALGTVQVVGNKPAPGFVTGTATLKTRFAPGMFQLAAQYNGTGDFRASISEPQQLTVTGTESTITTLTDQPDGNNWDFTALVFGFGFPVATGTASFTDLATLVNLGNVGLVGPGMSSFQPQQTYPTGNTPLGVASGDFNGDGIADLAVTNHGDGTVGVLLGNADGTFPQQNPTYMVGNFPYGIAVGDFNADGIVDLAVTNNADGTVSILLGDGSGKFSPARGSPYRVDPQPQGIAVADFNGDGIADLAVANAGDNPGTVSLLLGNGDGTFQPQRTFTVGANPAYIAVGDFNGDGIADLAVTNLGPPGDPGDTVSVLLGIGNGTFQEQVTYQVGSAPVGIAVGDFNGDGIADLAVANFYGNDPSGQSPGTVSILLGDGTGKFSPAPGMPPAVDYLPYAIAVADFKGDGIADLAVTNSCGDDPSCQSPGTVSLLLGKGDGTFEPQQSYATGGAPLGIAASDFNGDGVPDLAIADEGDNTVSILLGGTVTSGQLKNVPVSGSGLHMIQSTYAPNNGFYKASLSNKINVNGNGSLISTTTVVTSSVNPSQLNQSVTFTALITGNGGGLPTGTVNFTNNGAPSCNAVPLDGGGQAQCTTAALTLGVHAIVATYSGDQNFATSQGRLNQVVQASTTTTVTSSVNPSQLNQQVTFTATVASSNGGSPTGTVAFTADNMPIADCGAVQLMPVQNGSKATCQISTLALGVHNIQVTYGGDQNFSGSAGGLSQVVQGKTTPTVALTASPNPVNYGSNEYLTATVQSAGGGIPTGTVNVMEGSTLLGTASLMADPSGQFSVATYINNTLVVGSHMITATYNGDSNFNNATSNTVPLELLTAFTVTGQPPSNNSGTVSPGGNVTFPVAVNAAWQDHPLIYAVMDCKPPAGAGITCSITCPPSPSNPPGLSNLCVLTQMTGTVATVTVYTSGAAHVILPVHRGERRVVATLMGLGGIGLVGLVLLPFNKLRGQAVGGVLFLVIVVLAFGTSCGGNFAPGLSSPPVNNTFYIAVNAELREENPTASTGYNMLGLQTFLYSLLIK